jgi:hypothetical protein
MLVSLPECKHLVRAIAPSGNLFLLLLLQELRQQGMTFIAFYALQRVIDEPGISQFQLRRETGLENHEISRGCKFLADSGTDQDRSRCGGPADPCAKANQSRGEDSRPRTFGGGEAVAERAIHRRWLSRRG